MTIAAYTLGCKLNYAETSHILRQLSTIGHTIVPFEESADLYIVNTCTVTSTAEKKCRHAVASAHRRNPHADIAVVGCFAQRSADLISSFEGVTIVLGNDNKHRLVDIIEKGQLHTFSVKSHGDLLEKTPFELAYSTEGRTRAFLKIQDGCDYFCTYCAIPFARGRSRSATISEVVAAAEDIAANGIKEIVLTGVNTGTFGRDSNEDFLQCIQALDKVQGVERYRISSIEPNLLTDDILLFIQHSRSFLPHFHIPLQAGSDHVLTMMKRRYTTALYQRKVERIKALMPDACIAADIMAGFNGEDEEHFLQTLQFINQLPISYLHVFTYSERPQTAALRMGERIDIHTRRQHTAALLDLSEKKYSDFIASQLGKKKSVLWESSLHDGGMMQGWTDNYIRVQTPFDERRCGNIEDVLLEEDNIINQR